MRYRSIGSIFVAGNLHLVNVMADDGNIVHAFGLIDTCDFSGAIFQLLGADNDRESADQIPHQQMLG